MRLELLYRLQFHYLEVRIAEDGEVELVMDVAELIWEPVGD